MFTSVMRLFEQICLIIFFSCILSFSLTTIAFAEMGNSKSQIEQKYGDCFLVQDELNRIWTQNEWKSVASADAKAKAYGYITKDGEINVISWFEYSKQNRVVKETTTMDGAIKIRDFKNHFRELYADIVAPDSAVFVIGTFPKRQLGVIIREKNNKFNLIRFFMDNSGGNTTINMHSKILGFEIEELAPSNAKKYLKMSKSVQLVPSDVGEQGGRAGTWLRTDNYFQPEIFFSEKLVPRKTTDMIVIHHTALENMSVADIHELHLTKGWAGIAYHKVILPNGTVENGRPEKMVGAHALGANPRSIGIVLVGNFEIAPPAPIQMDALVNLTLELMKKYHIPLENVQPHRDVTQGTVCPGALFPWEGFIQRLKTNAGKTSVAS